MSQKRKPVVVKTFKTRRQMQRGIERMAERSYEVQTQSGEFSTNPFVWRWNRRKVVVTFRLPPEPQNDERRPAPPGEG